MLTKLLRKSNLTLQLTRAFVNGKIFTREELKNNNWRLDYGSQANRFTHKSDAREYIEQVPVIKVKGDKVRCQGGTVAGIGHPAVYIQLNTRNAGEAKPCPYCGLRYAMDLDDH